MREQGRGIQCDVTSPCTLGNGTVLPDRPVNVLFDVVTLREIFSAAISLWIYMSSNNAFRPHEFAEGPGMGELELMLSESKEPEEDFNSHALSPSTHGQFVEVAYSNQSPRWRLVQSCLWGSGIGRWDDKSLCRLDRSLSLGTAVQIVEKVETSSNTLEVGHADDGVFPSLRDPPGVACGSTNREGALTIVISPS